MSDRKPIFWTEILGAPGPLIWLSAAATIVLIALGVVWWVT